MKQNRPIIQIGPITDDPTESVSAVSKSFIQGLKDDYDFVPVTAKRKYGTTRQAMFNVVNGYYFLKHLASWLFHSAASRPEIAHYAVSSGWAMEKGIIFLGLARALGARTVGHLHSGAFIDHWNTIPKWRRKWAARQLRKLDAMVVLSDYWREAVAANVGIPREKLFVVNNPIDQAFEKAALQMPIERAECVILSLGAMCREKGVVDSIEAAKMAAPRVKFRLELVGPEREPDIHQQVRQFVADHSLSKVVDVKPGVWGDEKARLFREASIFLLPSYFENFPLVVLEAAAAGHAIITTPVGATPEFFKDGVSALFVEPGNAEQIAQAIIKLAGDPEERGRLARAARETFSGRLARARIMRSLDSVYQAVLTTPEAAAAPARTSQREPLPTIVCSGNNANGSMVANGDTNSTTAYFTSQVERFATQYQNKVPFRDRLNLFLEAVQRTTRPPARILDFGCGPGIMCMALGQLGYEVLGLDGARGMVETAREKAASLKLSRVRFEQSDADRLDVSAGAFDVVICSSVIEYIEDDLQLLRKLVESLKPGGHLLLSVPHNGSVIGKAEDLLSLSRRFLRREGSRHLTYTLRRYRRSELLRNAQSMGLEIRNCTTFELPLLGESGVKLSRWSLLGRMMLVEGRKNIPGSQSSDTNIIDHSRNHAYDHVSTSGRH